MRSDSFIPSVLAQKSPNAAVSGEKALICSIRRGRAPTPF
jgi:hypothetical protein